MAVFILRNSSGTDLYSLQFETKKTGRSIFLGNTGVDLTGHIDSVDAIQIKGSTLQQQYQQWSKAWRVITAKAGAFIERVMLLRKKRIL